MSTVQEPSVANTSIDAYIERQLIHLEIEKSDGRGLAARICGKTIADGRAVRVMNCGILTEPDETGRFRPKFIIGLSDNGRANVWSGWCDDLPDAIEISYVDDCRVLASPDEPPIKIY